MYKYSTRGNGKSRKVHLNCNCKSISRTKKGIWFFLSKYYRVLSCLNINEDIFCHRDLPLAAVIALLTISGVYTLTNVAYFSALSPSELLQSPAVALVRRGKISICTTCVHEISKLWILVISYFRHLLRSSSVFQPELFYQSQWPFPV